MDMEWYASFLFFWTKKNFKFMFKLMFSVDSWNNHNLFPQLTAKKYFMNLPRKKMNQSYTLIKIFLSKK